MDEKKIRVARNIIKISVILRLIWNVLLSIWMASSYSESWENLYRVFDGGTDLPIVIAGLLIDTLLTVLWLYKPVFHTAHLTAYICFGWIYYGMMILELEAFYGLGAVVAVFVFMPLMCIIGIIPFIVCIVGRIISAKAMKQSQIISNVPDKP